VSFASPVKCLFAESFASPAETPGTGPSRAERNGKFRNQTERNGKFRKVLERNGTFRNGLEICNSLAANAFPVLRRESGFAVLLRRPASPRLRRDRLRRNRLRRTSCANPASPSCFAEASQEPATPDKLREQRGQSIDLKRRREAESRLRRRPDRPGQERNRTERNGKFRKVPERNGTFRDRPEASKSLRPNAFPVLSRKPRERRGEMGS